MAVSPNTVLGKYRIIREIARSNDIVYEAIDPKMNRRVAIKELQLPLHLAGAQKRERVERFYREAKAAGALTHPHIVTIHEIGQENDRHFLVMEYLDGQSLRDILQLQGALPLKETVEIALQMCEALGFAHSHGVVHRDVKPDNIHILPGGTIKLTDFGIARITAEPSITSQGQVFGTPSYMSPEQVASQTVDHRTDLFSMGITLYEMLTGRKPFVGDSVITITYNIMNSQPPMPVGVPPALQNILQKALAKDANLRYQSAAAMSADLRAEKFALALPQGLNDPRNRTGDGEMGHLGGMNSLDTGMISPFPGIGNQGLGGQQPGAVPQVPSPHSYGQAPAAGQSYQDSAAAGVNSAGGGPSQTQVSPVAGGMGAYDAGNMRRRQTRGTGTGVAGLLLSAFGLIVIIVLIIYGLIQAFHAVEMRGKRAEADRYAVQAAQALRRGNYQAAATAFQSAQTAAPSNTPEAQSASQGLSSVETAQAQQEAQSGNAAAAQQTYEQAIAQNRQNADAYDSLGTLRWRQQDENGALDAWESAVRADASSPAAADARTQATQVYQSRAQKAATSNNYAEAATEYQKIIAINPGSAAAQQAQQAITSLPLSGLGGAH